MNVRFLHAFDYAEWEKCNAHVQFPYPGGAVVGTQLSALVLNVTLTPRGEPHSAADTVVQHRVQRVHQPLHPRAPATHFIVSHKQIYAAATM